MSNTILEFKGVKKKYEKIGGLLNKSETEALKDVNFSINQNETFAIVGESGCGKSTIGKLLLGLTDKSSGTIKFEGRELNYKNKLESKQLRNSIQIVFQDPFLSFNPKLTIYESLKEFSLSKNKAYIQNEIQNIFKEVGLNPNMIFRRPKEFSGGQLQRISIARTLLKKPKLIFLDEPTSALDVSIRKQIIDLLKEKKKQYDMSYLIVSHDLRIVSYLADHVAVMYQGNILELCSKTSLFNNPQHPYTKNLLKVSKIHKKYESFSYNDNENLDPNVCLKCNSKFNLTSVSKNHFVKCCKCN